MDNKELIFYIIFGLIYLLSRIGRKKRKQQAQGPPPITQKTKPLSRPVQPQAKAPTRPAPQPMKPVYQQQQDTPEGIPPMSFEDILKELSGEGRRIKEQRESPQQPPEPKPVERKPLVSEPAPEPETPAYEFSNNPDQDTEASELWAAYKMTDEDKEKAISRASARKIKVEAKESFNFNVYEQKKKENPLASEIREMLKDKEDVRKAVVLAEILKCRW